MAIEFGPDRFGVELKVNSEELPNGTILVVDVETDERGNFVGIGVMGSPLVVHYYSVLRPDLCALLASSNLVGHNLKFDARQLKGWGVNVRPEQLVQDTMLKSYVRSSTKESHGLKELAREYLNMEWPSYKDMVGKGKAKQTLDKQEVERVAAYCGDDCVATWRLNEYFDKVMTPPQKSFYSQIELPTMQLLYKMELVGVTVDVDYLKELKADFDFDVTSLRQQLQQLLLESQYEIQCKKSCPKKEHTHEFNPASPLQVKSVLSHLGYNVESTDKQALEGFRKDEFVSTLLELRKIAKVSSTYIDAWLELPTLPKIHTTYNQVALDSATDSWKGIRTGRLSSSEPNLHNIPKPSDDEEVETTGKALRRAFIASPGNSLIVADYCVVPSTKILKADLTWTDAKDISVGEKLVGFDEFGDKLRISIVEGVKGLEKNLIRIVTDRGAVTCSTDHMWLVKRRKYGIKSEAKYRVWVQSDKLTIDDEIVFFKEPWETKTDFDAGWISGIFDGEGWVYQGVGFGQNDGLVLDRVKNLLTKDGYSFKVHKSKQGCNKFRISGDRESLRFLGSYRPKRLLEKSKQLWEGRRSWNLHSNKHAKVLSTQLVGFGQVVAIQTSSKTFIANGFFSHNCQIQYRLLAHYSKEPILIKAFLNGEDVHEATGRALGVNRSIGKTLNFAAIFGAFPEKIAQVAKCSEDQAKEFLARYWRVLPGVRIWMERVKMLAKVHRSVKTIFGRSIPINDIDSQDRGLRAHAERTAINYIIQGGEADVMKVAMREVHKAGYLPILQVHDEIHLDVPIADAQMVSEKVKSIMESIVALDVPLTVSIGNADNWYGAK